MPRWRLFSRSSFANCIAQIYKNDMDQVAFGKIAWRALREAADLVRWSRPFTVLVAVVAALGSGVTAWLVTGHWSLVIRCNWLVSRDWLLIHRLFYGETIQCADGDALRSAS